MNFTTEYHRNLNQWLVYATVDGQPNGDPLGTHATEAEALEQIRLMQAVAPLIAYVLRHYNAGMAAGFAEQTDSERAAWMDEAIEAVIAEAKAPR